jgi:DNA-directed RNA polymerase subunit RPC12/RpoP
MTDVYCANPNRTVENSLEPDYIACDVCGFGIDQSGTKVKCPCCGSIYFRNDPMKFDVRNQRGPKIQTLTRR